MLKKGRPAFGAVLQLFEIALSQGCFDRVEVRKLLRIVARLAINDIARLIDDESRTLRNALESYQIFEKHIVSRAYVLIEVTQEREFEAAIRIGERFLRKRTINADAVNLGIETIIIAERIANRAKFILANAGESEWKEQQDRGSLSVVVAQSDVGQAFIVFRF